MSTTTLTDASQTTSSSSPSPTSSQSNSDTATLYLFTFLATILILVLLSASLVLRSYIVRRRYRRRFQRALSDTLFVDFNRGTFNGVSQFDPLGLHRSTRRVGPKPVMWDTWIHAVDVDSWSSCTPVAVRRISPSPPLTSASWPQPSTTPPGSLSSQSTSAILAQLRLPGPLYLTSIPSSPRQAHTPVGSPVRSSVRLPPPPVPTSSDNIDKDDVTLAVCVLVAMPDGSAPTYRSVPDAKGKAVDIECQAPPPSGDADPLLSPHRPGRISNVALDEEGLPWLEFGVVEVEAGDWAWRLQDT